MFEKTISLQASDAGVLFSSRVVIGDIHESLSDLEFRCSESGVPKEALLRLRRICAQMSVIQGGLDSFFEDYKIVSKGKAKHPLLYSEIAEQPSREIISGDMSWV